MDYDTYIRTRVRQLEALSDAPQPWLVAVSAVCFFTATVIVVGTILSHWLVSRGLNIGVN